MRIGSVACNAARRQRASQRSSLELCAWMTCCRQEATAASYAAAASASKSGRTDRSQKPTCGLAQ